MPSGPNLFARLHKWAARQDENFLTESLAVVLEQLLILAPEVGVRMVSRLTREFIHLSSSEAGSVAIRPQPKMEGEKKRADLELCTPHRLVWIEVKVKSPLHEGQLEAYLALLEKSEIQPTQLVLLTLNPGEVPREIERQVLNLRWFDFAD